MKEEILLNEQQISEKVKELGAQITKDYKNKNLCVISLLRGSFMFMSDLVRHIDMPICIDFMTTSSYEDAEESTGKVKILTDVRENLENYDVLIVDDIIDSGNTIVNTLEYIKQKNPKSVKTCVLLDKPSRRQVAYNADYVGFEIEDVFIVGYGLNYKSSYRNIPYIFIWNQDV
ncbi:hypoxanthine phosphoribosyltransferase [uncultured Finegoldia sp.]|uniref:hypoxanthine phosphoribosyltransferase n=1 Tax=uncultured Finegoldia sp. TaxID=328009 RepID=UPI0025E41C7C|nr:hypoxanthine phosphoribosyltransferase [uncultured Finegoldia sp.]MDU1831631.1 hypoxanthine phosphoribosyltransferase [Finegoldia magna]